MPQFFKQLMGIMLLVVFCTSCGCVTLFNSVNFKNAPRNSFVKIEVATDEYISSGSGVIINHLDNSNTIILTAGHLCKDNTIAMRVIDLFGRYHEILSFVKSEEDDLCIIVASNIIEGDAIKLANQAPEIADHIYNIAAPGGIYSENMALMFDGYYQGQIGISGEKYIMDLYSIPGKGGSSGSPIFNNNWEIIGIVSRGIEDFQHIMVSVKHSRIKLFYDYSFTDEFKLDVHLASIEYNKKMLDFINKLMSK